MKWRLGMIKAWFAFSACWVGFWSWYYDIASCGPLHLGEDTNMGWHCHGSVAEAGDSEIVPLVVMVAMIIGVSNRSVADGHRHSFARHPRSTRK
jgi:hypothetical protein